MRCFRKLPGISYRDQITNDAVKDRIGQAIGPYDGILTAVKKRKLKWFRRVARSAGHTSQFYHEQCKEGVQEDDKRRVGSITSFSGQG